MTRTEPPHVVDPVVLKSIDDRLIKARERSAEIQSDVIDRLLRERTQEAGQ